MHGQSPPGVLVARILLLALLTGGGWLALQPELNLARLTPNRWMRALGIPYEDILAYEHSIQWVWHALVAFALTCLLHRSRLLPAIRSAPHWMPAALSALVLAIVAEILQILVGRGFDSRDLLAGLVGIAVAIPLSRR